MKPIPVIAAAALVLLTAACGSPSAAGSGSPVSAGGSASPSLLAFAQCMRSHSVPNFPDPQPSSGAKFPGAQQLGVSSSQYQTAENACQSLLPAGADDQFPQAELPYILSGMRQFSQCMRSHGVPDWPDPTLTSQGRPVFDLEGIPGLDTHDLPPQDVTADNECEHLEPAQLGGEPVER